MVIVQPLGSFRQTHEDRFCAAVRLQTEDCATVVYEIEFCIPATTDLLPFLLFFCKWVVFMFFDDRTVCCDDVVGSILTEFEDLLRVTVVQIIKEDSAQPTTLTTMFDQEIIIGPFLELIVVCWIVTVADIFVSSMKVSHIVLIDIDRCDISSTTEPPMFTVIRFEVSVVEMHGRAVGVTRVHDTTQAAGKERDLLTVTTTDTTFSRSLQCLDGHGTMDDT
mmetsp:Transcript_6060/g.15072  ORF Transcript_6060/g.15072 Transcript_6060/m.15072 type:complete len:221 (+) Transcript_6060:237-899(+)